MRILCFFAVFCCLGLGQTILDIKGKVLDVAGSGISGASVSLLEGALFTTTDSLGIFSIRGALGVFRPAIKTENGLNLMTQGLSLRVDNPGTSTTEISWLRIDGKSLLRTVILPRTSRKIDLEPGAPRAAHRILVVKEGGRRRAYPVFVLGGNIQAGSFSLPRTGIALARRAVDSFPRLTLEVSAPGFLTKRHRLTDSTPPDTVRITLLPQNASLQDRIRNFISDTLTLRVAWLSVVTPPTYRLNFFDQTEIVGDSVSVHPFTSSNGATLPAWSPDGNYLAYETGREGATVNGGGAISRIFIQPLAGGARLTGPGFPSTNPRFWTNGTDTALVWSASGNDNAWTDTSGTWFQNFAGGQLQGAPRKIATGGYNAGLSKDSNWLAGGSPRGVMLNRSTGQKFFSHVYPGSLTPLVDSLQVCNVSISPHRTSPQAMFIDFGVFSAPGYPNRVTPKRYLQHQIILVSDPVSTNPGGIVDFIDTPANELAQNKTWDDPEWSNQEDFAVASTRGYDGLGNLVQPDLYLIKLSTRESLKLMSGAGYYMPIAWMGRK